MRSACAKAWRDLDKTDAGRQVAHVIRVGQRIFGKTAVDRIPAVLLRFAQRLPSALGRMQIGMAHAARFDLDQDLSGARGPGPGVGTATS
jgi:hypothetical protein